MRQMMLFVSMVHLGLAPRMMSQTPPASAKSASQGHNGETRVTGLYRNPDYGYSVMIPQIAYRMKAPAPNHGITIDIDGATIWTNGEYDTEGSTSLESAVRRAIDFWSRNSDLHLAKDSPTSLSRLPARDVVLEGTNNENRLKFVRFLMACRPKKEAVGIVYTIGIRSTSDTPPSEDVFIRLVKSFRTWIVE